MSPTEIIRQDVIRRGGDAERIIRALGVVLKAKRAVMLATESSVLILKNIGNGAVEAHLFTVAQPNTLATDIRTFAEKIKRSSIGVLYMKPDNQQVAKFIQSLGFNVTKSDRPDYTWKVVM